AKVRGARRGHPNRPGTDEPGPEGLDDAKSLVRPESIRHPAPRDRRHVERTAPGALEPIDDRIRISNAHLLVRKDRRRAPAAPWAGRSTGLFCPSWTGWCGCWSL